MSRRALSSELARRQVQRLRRWIRSPKGLLTVVLLGLAAIAAPVEGLGRVAPALGGAVAAAVAADLVLQIARRGRAAWPDGAVLSGLIVALVLSPAEPLYVPPVAAALAVASKHMFLTPPARRVHVFNPAAVGLLACLVLFASGESWWGALPSLPAPALLLVVGAGAWIAARVRKLPQVLAFLGTYVGLLTVLALLTLGSSEQLAALYRVPYLNAVLFLAFFMLTDPPTSPNTVGEQMVFGGVVGLVTYGAFLAVPGLAFLLVGLLSGNLWLAWQRRRQSVVSPAPRGRAVAGRRDARS
jgi:Na+-translocating ferredoxin:NAD+ oxidoreductase RnfD subunit